MKVSLKVKSMNNCWFVLKNFTVKVSPKFHIHTRINESHKVILYVIGKFLCLYSRIT